MTARIRQALWPLIKRVFREEIDCIAALSEEAGYHEGYCVAREASAEAVSDLLTRSAA